MSKSTEGKTPNNTRVKTTQATKKSDTALSDTVLAAAMQSIKKPAALAPGKDLRTSATASITRSKKVNSAAKRDVSRETLKPPQMPSQDLINKMVEEAAYYLAEKRNFAPGFEEQDWLTAKEQIKRQLEGTDNPLK